MGKKLATPCGLYCGSCRFYLGKQCAGCGTADREGCAIFACCHDERHLRFCAECTDFPCERLRSSVGLHPGWLERQAEISISNIEETGSL